MKKRAYLMMGLALLLAAVTVLLAQKFLLTPNSAPSKAEVKTTKIVIAKNRLNYGAIINREHLRLMPWPSGAVPEGSFTSFSDLVRRDGNRVVLRRIEKDEPILKSKVSGFGGRASLSSIISTNMRAATIRVNDVNGVAGFVLPGDRVDILITRDRSGGTGRRRIGGGANLATDILLQNVKVLGIDQDADDSMDKPAVAKAVTVEVEPHQAQKLILAQRVGTLSLALRNVNNSETTENRTVTLRDLGISEVVEKKATPKPHVRHSFRRRVTVVKRQSSVKITRGLTSSKYDVPREPRVIPKKRSSRVASSEAPLSNRQSSSDRSTRSSITTPDEARSTRSSITTSDKSRSVDRSAAGDGPPIQLYRPSLRPSSDQKASSGRDDQATVSLQ